VIVAVNDDEVSRLRNLYVRALTNEVPGIKLIDAKELKLIEPHCQVSC
jgi:2-hydroxyglutarate dehydrogenase